MPQEKKGKSLRARKSPKHKKAPAVRIEEPKCYIHDKVDDWLVEHIRENICVKDKAPTELEGRYYCLFHLPTNDKDIDEFERKFKSKLEAIETEIYEIAELPDEQKKARSKPSYDFRYVWFPSEVDLSSHEFLASVHFGAATFSSYANFNGAIFPFNVSFWQTVFSSYVDFSMATFLSETDFMLATFTETSQTLFSETRFCQTVHFNYTGFAGYVTFKGTEDQKVFLDRKAVSATKEELDSLKLEFEERGINSEIFYDDERNQEAILNLQEARLENPERFTFHRVRLRPSWFVNTDSRKIVFTNVDWDNLGAKRDNSNITSEIISLKNRFVDEPSRLLEITCRQLAVNAEENHRYEDATKFRYMAMETKRLEKESFWTIEWWYRFSSGYGEDWKRAAVVFLGILAIFGFLYFTPLTSFDYGEPKPQTVNTTVQQYCDKARTIGKENDMNLCDAAVHSLFVAALQRPEPKAADPLTKFFVVLETIFAPLQAALLALAIRRKFMR